MATNDFLKTAQPGSLESQGVSFLEAANRLRKERGITGGVLGSDVLNFWRQAPQTNNTGMGGGGTGLTLNAGDFVNRDIVPQVNQTIQNPFTQLTGGLQSRADIAAGLEVPQLSEADRERIRQQVQLEFAPQRERIQRGAAAREEQFDIQRAQRSAGTFGLGDREAAGINELDAQERRELSQFDRTVQAEIQQRIAAAEGRERDAFFDTQGLINQIQSSQLQQLSTLANLYNQDRRLALQAQQNAAAQAGNTLEYISNLDDTGIQQLINQEGAGVLNELESTLGLPQGYIDQLRAAKARAAQAETQEEIDAALNEATEIALRTPEGTDFTYVINGEPIRVSGQEQATQIVSSDGGIFLVDKNKGDITTLRQPTPRGGGGLSGLTESQIAGLEDFASFALDQAEVDGQINKVALQEAINDLPLTREQKQGALQIAINALAAGSTITDGTMQEGTPELTPFGEDVRALGVGFGNILNTLVSRSDLNQPLPERSFSPINLNETGGVTTPGLFLRR